MTELPPDDPRLSAFLRRYQPAPPKTQSDLEDYLLARIEQDAQPQSKSSVFWVLSSAIVAGMIMGWGAYRYSTPPQLMASGPELENFILENWNVKSTETAYFDNNPSLTSEWLLLTSPNPHYVVSRP